MKKKKTIAYLIYNTKHNGGNKVVFEHVNRLKKNGYDTNVYTISGAQPKWFHLKTKVQPITKLLFLKPDCLIATFWPTAYIVVLLKAKNKFYLIQGWEQEFYKNMFIKVLTHISLHLPINKIVISNYLKNKLNKINILSKIYIIKGNGIQRVKKNKFLNNTNKNIHILSILSTYSYYKGSDLLAKCVKNLKDKNPNFIFTLVSSNEIKPISNSFDYFYHNISDKKLAELYNKSDFLLSTARDEGFFLPGLEAMNHGCIFITTNSGGINEYAISGINSFIYKNTEGILKSNIFDKLITNKKLLDTLRNNGYKTVAKFSWNNIIKNLEEIYND